MSLTWTDDRAEELILLQRLIREVSTINNGNRCLQRIAECIELADKLNEWDSFGARPSFLRFLIEQCGENRRANREALAEIGAKK